MQHPARADDGGWAAAGAVLPPPKRIRLPRWPAMLMHQACGPWDLYPADDHIYGPDEPTDMRCTGCRAGAEVRVMEDLGVILLVIVHQPGCALAAALRV